MWRLLLVALVACSSADGAPAPAANYRACARDKLPAANRRDAQHAFDTGRCHLRDVVAENPRRGLATVLGRPLARDEERVVVLEAASRARFDALVACDDAPRIDFAKQHVQLVVVYGMGTRGSVQSVYDDGKTATLVVYSSSRSGCGGRAYGQEFQLEGVLVPADRAVEIMPCADDPRCTGMEK